MRHFKQTTNEESSTKKMMKTKRSSKDSAISTHLDTAFSVEQSNSDFEVAEAKRSVLEMIISLVLSCWWPPGIARQVQKRDMVEAFKQVFH